MREICLFLSHWDESRRSSTGGEYVRFSNTTKPKCLRGKLFQMLDNERHKIMSGSWLVFSYSQFYEPSSLSLCPQKWDVIPLRSGWSAYRFSTHRASFSPPPKNHVTPESLPHQMSLSYTSEAKLERSHDSPVIHSSHFPLAFWITICFLCSIFLFCY